MMRVIAEKEHTNTPGPRSARWSRLRPAYLADGEEWKPLDNEERMKRFPTEGLVFWYQAPVEAESQTLWTLELHLEEPARREKDKDHWKVQSGDPTVQFVEVGAASEVRMRRQAAAGELELSEVPLGPAMLRAPDSTSRWIGPIKVENFSVVGGVARGPAAVPTGFLRVYEIDAANLQKLDLNGREVRVLRPHLHLNELPAAYWVAQDDQKLLAAILKRVKTLDPDLPEALGVVDAASRVHTDLIEESTLDGDDLLRARARSTALRQMLDHAELSNAQVSAAAEALLAVPEISARVDELVALQASAQQEKVEAEHAAHRKQLEAEIATLDEAVLSLKQQLQGLEANSERAEEELRRRLTRAVEGILRDPIESLAGDVVTQALLSALTCGPADAKTQTPSKPMGRTISSLQDLVGFASVLSSCSRLNENDCLSAVAALLSGRRFLVGGDLSARLTDVIGTAISSGLTWSASVPTTVFGLDDLLNLPVAPVAEGASATRLGELLRVIGESEHMVSVILRGVNRAPLEAAYQELSELLDGRHGNSEDPTVAWSGEGGVVARLRVPRNLIIAGTLFDGPTCFRVSQSLSRRNPVVVPTEPEEDTTETAAEGLSGHLDAATWFACRREAIQAGCASLFDDEEVSRRSPDAADLAIYVGVFKDVHVGIRAWASGRGIKAADASVSSLGQHLAVKVRAALTDWTPEASSWPQFLEADKR